MLDDLLAQGEHARVMNAVAAGTTSQNSSGVNMENADSVLFAAAIGTITAGAVTSIKAQQSDDDGSSDSYDDIAGTSVAIADTQSNKVALLNVQRPLKKWVRLVVVRGTQNAVIDGVFAVKYNLRKEPATQPATIVATSKTVVGPAEGTA